MSSSETLPIEIKNNDDDMLTEELLFELIEFDAKEEMVNFLEQAQCSKKEIEKLILTN